MADKNYAVVTGEGDEQEIKFYETEVADSIPVEHDIPAGYDETKQVASVSRVLPEETKVVIKYRIEDKPQRSPRFSFDEFADMVADKVIERWQG